MSAATIFHCGHASCLQYVCNNHKKHALYAGLVGRSFVGFESVGWFGYYGFPTSARPWQNQTLWNWSQKCNSNIQTNWYCGILYAIFGYQVCNCFHFLMCMYSQHLLWHTSVNQRRQYLYTAHACRIQSAQTRTLLLCPCCFLFIQICNSHQRACYHLYADRSASRRVHVTVVTSCATC